MFSSVLGAVVGLGLIALGRQHWSGRLPYGPYIAVAATGWVFGGSALWERLFGAR
jgi:leader peptidase (prepilin peptidase)/N-methyltransferase